VVVNLGWDWHLFDVADGEGDRAADEALVRRLVHAYADWQQAWMPHAAGSAGTRR
jgi:hypothetical protein